MKKILALILAMLMVLALAACSEAPAATEPAATEPAATQPGATEPAKEDPLVFGIAMPQLDNDGFKANMVGIRQFADANGIEIVVNDAKNTADVQMQNVEDLITKGVDAIVMCPVDSGAAAAAVQKAVDANIPVISFDRNVSGDLLAGLAESNNTAHGAAAADLMAEQAEASGLGVEGLVVLELMGTQSASAGLERHVGFADRAKELGINIVSALPADFKNDVAYNCVLDAFSANPNINAIYIPSDNACYAGVESALSQLGKLIPVGEPGHIMIVTVDGGPLGLEGIRNGYVDAIAAQSKLLMSEEAMSLALKIVKGEAVEQNIIRINPTKVTKENVDDPSLWANAIKEF